jgi:hypothetical protein
MGWAGEPEAAVGFSDRGCSLADRLGDKWLYHGCCDGKADLLLQSGRSQEARAVLAPLSTDAPPYGRLTDSLRWASVLKAVGDATAADWLVQTYALIEQYGYRPFLVAADALAREF